MSERATCESCRWWDAPWNLNRSGNCHRLPPTGQTEFEINGRRPRGIFPTAHPDDWCGEHQPRETGDG